MSRRFGVALVGLSSPGYRSLASAYLRAACDADPRLETVDVRVLDLTTAVDPWWVAYRVLSLDPMPDVVGLSAVCWNARAIFETARVIKLARPETFIVAGGPEVGPIAEATLAEQPWLDAVVVGEGERPFPELVHALSRGGDPAAVPGVVSRVGGRIVTGPQAEPVVDLDSIASPYLGASVATDGSAYVETYRGCPHRCAYCFEGKGETRIRSFSWDRIASDIEAVASTPGMRAFSFIDPVFNLTSERLERLSELMRPWVARGIRLHTIEVDVERIDDEQAALLTLAGVASVETGPQSVGRRALATCARSFDPERFRAGVEACRRAGITVECDLIIGLPGDSARDVYDGIEFVIGCDPGIIQMSTLHVLPGTSLWEQAPELGLVFDPLPPHEVISTAELDFAALRRLETFGQAVTTAYRARISPKEH